MVLAAVEALDKSPGSGWAFCQSTTGQAQMIIVNGPVRERLGFNSKVNVFGDGFRANATVGRAMRLIIMNALGIRPQEFDQSAQGTPAKYSFCIAENEEDSPWEPWHVEKGYPAATSVATAFYANGSQHVMTQAGTPEGILLPIAEALTSGGRGRGFVVVMGPQHAQIIARHGWSKAATKRFLWQNWGRRASELARLRAATGEADQAPGGDEFVRFGESPDSILLLVAGGNTNAISTVVRTTGTSFDLQPIAEPRG